MALNEGDKLPGGSLLEMTQDGPAAVDLARALELEPKQYLALTQLGSMLEELDDPARAIEALRRSLEINPHQQDAIDAKARLEAADTGTNI